MNRHTAIPVRKVPTEEVASKAPPRSWLLLFWKKFVAVLMPSSIYPEIVEESMPKGLVASQLLIPDTPAMTCRTRSGIPE